MFITAAITTSVITTVEGVNDEVSIAIDFVTVDDLIWDFLDQANANNLGGHNDWRIPNYYELPSIVDIGNCSPVIDATVFPSTPSIYHWTTSTNPCGSTSAFSLNFSYGEIKGFNKKTYKLYVRLVRS